MHIGTHEQERQFTNGKLKDNQRKGYHCTDPHTPHQDAGIFGQVPPSEGLRRDATRTHAQESKQPIHEIENHATDGNGTDVGRCTQVSHDAQVNQSQQRHSDVAHNGRYGNAKYSAIHSFQH